MAALLGLVLTFRLTDPMGRAAHVEAEAERPQPISIQDGESQRPSALELAGENGRPPGELGALERELAGRGEADEAQPVGEGPASVPLVTGRALDPHGQGLAGARVLLSNAYSPRAPLEAQDALGSRIYPGVEVESDENGNFCVQQGLQDQMGMSLVVLAPPYQPYRSAGHWIYPGTTTEVGDLTLQPGVTLRGLVVGPLGEGLAARLVRPTQVMGHAGYQELGESADDGSFELQGLSPGEWELVALADGYLPLHEHGILSSDEPAPVLRIQLARGVDLSGTLVGSPPGAPPFEIHAHPTEPLSDWKLPATSRVAGDGAFCVTGVHPGAQYELSVVAIDGADKRELEEVEPVRVVAAAQAIQLQWAGPTGVHGILVDAQSGEPVERATLFYVKPHRPPSRLATGPFAEGRFQVIDRTRFADLACELRVHAPGYLDTVVPVHAQRAGQVTDLGRVLLHAGPTLLVHVSNSAGAPVANAEVRLGRNYRQALDKRAETAHLRPAPHWMRTVTTDSAGSAILSHLGKDLDPAASGLLAVFADGYAPAWVPVQPGRQERLDVLLTAGAELSILAKDSAGNRLDGVIVELQRTDDGWWPPHADSTRNGYLTISSLAPGSYRFRSRVETNSWRPADYDAEAAWRNVQLVDGQTTEARLECGGFYNLGGSVTDPGGPLAGAQLVLLPGDRTVGDWSARDSRSGRGSRFHVESRADGSFDFYVINEGTYTLLVEHPSLTLATRLLVEIVRNPDPLSIHLNPTVLAGRVTLQDGSPVPGALVAVREAPGPGYGQTTTGPDGLYRITGTKPKHEHTLEVDGRLIQYESRELAPLLPGERRSFNIECQARGAVHIHLSEGYDLDVRVLGRSEDGEHHAVATRLHASSSTLEASGLVPGPWIWEVRGAGEAEATVLKSHALQVKASQTVEWTFVP